MSDEQRWPDRELLLAAGISGYALMQAVSLDAPVPQNREGACEMVTVVRTSNLRVEVIILNLGVGEQPKLLYYLAVVSSGVEGGQTYHAQYPLGQWQRPGRDDGRNAELVRLGLEYCLRAMPSRAAQPSGDRATDLAR